jgi:hypothetical protein
MRKGGEYCIIVDKGSLSQLSQGSTSLAQSECWLPRVWVPILISQGSTSLAQSESWLPRVWVPILISIVSLCTINASASVSNVNTVCYSKILPTKYCIHHSITPISPQFLHSKPSIPHTESCVQIYKSSQHQPKM